MKKEVIIAIAIGFGLGLVITFGIWSANKALKQSAPQETQTADQETPTPTPTPITKPTALSLTILSPENNSVSENGSVLIKGSTSPAAVVVILFEKGEKILEADSEGQFSSNISLTTGSNEIKIKAYDKQGNEAEKILTIVYSTAEI